MRRRRGGLGGRGRPEPPHRDRATLVWPTGTGLFRDLCPLSDRTLRFEFFDERPWFVELLDRPAFRLPLVGEPAGVWRPFGFTRRFRVRRG